MLLEQTRLLRVSIVLSLMILAAVSVTMPRGARALTGSSTYTLAWMGYDWDGGREETLDLNGQFLASLPATDTPANGGNWTSFSLDITPLVANGTNTLTFTHAGWDRAISDDVKDLQLTTGSTIIYSSPTQSPLGCTQSLTYKFTVGTAPPPPPPLVSGFAYSPASPIIGQMVTMNGTATGGVPPYFFNWTFGDGSTGGGNPMFYHYSTPGTYTISLTVNDRASPTPNTQTTTRSVTVSPPPPPPAGTYLLSWQGYDWDGGHEETISLNGQVISSLPASDTPQNCGTWTAFSLNITSYVVKGTNTLTFIHANWDCSTSDNVRNLQIVNGSTTVYPNSTLLPLTCTESISITFTA